MPHCDNCGELIVEDDAPGAWVHEVSPAAFDPVQCVMGVSDGVAYRSWSGSAAVPCTNENCPDDLNPPWWTECVRA